jgi:hypothetical protein
VDLGKPVAVDRYQAGVAAEYAAFLDQVPWYQFPYAQRAGLLAVEPDVWGDSIRTYERKAQGTLAYSIKQTYADLINRRWRRHPIPPSSIFMFGALATSPERWRQPSAASRTRNLKRIWRPMARVCHQALPDLYRHDPAPDRQGMRFVEIGGNDEILVTVLSNDEIALPPGTRLLFGYQLPAELAVRRTGLTIAVRQLHTVLPALAAARKA